MAGKQNRYNGGHVSFTPFEAMRRLREHEEKDHAEPNTDDADGFADAISQQQMNEANEIIDQLRALVKKLESEIDDIKSLAEFKPGWVYLIRESGDGHYKIGKTTNIDDRLHTFNVKLPFKVEFICKIRARNYHQLEKDLHSMFAFQRVSGEWFALSPEDVHYICSLAQED